MTEEASVTTLQSSLTYLMTSYSKIVSFELPHCPACCALTVIEHLKMLLNHGEVQRSQVLCATYQRLLTEWEMLSEHQENNHPASTKITDNESDKRLLH
ncbi:MAG: hypothetical protein CSB47_01800 [Proteobacteria bacterium]|nr:MAG: hypothetical protein CSB47_01800 [Pseudomonadota bacterium]